MAEEFQSTTRLPELTLQLAAGTPMSPVYIAPEDSMQVTLLNTHATAIYCFSGRLLRPDGTTVPFVQELLKSTDGSDVANVIVLAEGYLLSACVLPLTEQPVRGDCFATMTLIRGMKAGVPYYAMLGSGYVSVMQPLIWPWAARNEATLETPGKVQVISAGPISGTPYVLAVPAIRAWLVKSINFTLATDAAAGDRVVQIAFFNLAVAVHTVRYSVAQPASTSHTYSAALGVIGSNTATETHHIVGLPQELMLLPGWAIQIAGAGVAGGDTFSSIAITVESFTYWGAAA